MSAYIIDEREIIPVIRIVHLNIAMRTTGQEEELIDRLKDFAPKPAESRVSIDIIYSALNHIEEI
ncbi:MAG: hypothetical protein WBZ36_20705 [Candidatus Nitrosopolaris sp.]